MIWTDDPLRDFDRYESERFLWEQSRPVCTDCGDPITDEYMYEFHGQYYCENCNQDHRIRIDD